MPASGAFACPRLARPPDRERSGKGEAALAPGAPAAWAAGLEVVQKLEIVQKLVAELDWHWTGVIARPRLN